MQITKEVYQAFKKHVEDADKARVAAAAEEHASSGGGSKAPKVPKLPPLGQVLEFACSLLQAHMRDQAERTEAVVASFREYQQV